MSRSAGELGRRFGRNDGVRGEVSRTEVVEIEREIRATKVECMGVEVREVELGVRFLNVFLKSDLFGF